MSRQRWTPPHRDPAKPQDTPVSKRRQQASPFGTTCAWSACTDQVDLIYRVGLCLKHANWIRNTMNAVDQQDDDRAEAMVREMAAEREATAAKIDAGIRIERGDRIPGWVYYIQIDDTIKIGYTKDIWSRTRSYPPTAKLLAVEPGTKTLERRRHSRFVSHLAHGREWFNDVPELREWIATLLTEYGDPSSKAYRFTQPGDARSAQPVTTPRGWTGKRTAA